MWTPQINPDLHELWCLLSVTEQVGVTGASCRSQIQTAWRLQGFSRGTSIYRGIVAHKSGRWEARIGVPGSKHIYLGLYDRDNNAAKAYDRALVGACWVGGNFSLRLCLTFFVQMLTALIESLDPGG